MLTTVKQWLKKHFIPHEHNDYRPHLLRREATTFILAIVLIIEACFLTQALLLSKTGLFATILGNVVIGETNGSREGMNLAPLREDILLDVAAKMKAEDMASKGYFAHTSPEGIDPWYWIAQVGYRYAYAGENLAINFVDSEDVVRAWLNSPAHRQNIMNQHFTEIGIGTARGTYEGRETVFVVQMFGAPAQLPAPLPVAPQPPVAATAPETAGTASVLAVTTSPEVLAAAESAAEPAAPTAEKTSPAAALAQKIATSPRTATGYLYALLGIVVFLALILNVVIRVEIQHPRLILNGVVMLLIIDAVLLLNNYLALANTEIF